MRLFASLLLLSFAASACVFAQDFDPLADTVERHVRLQLQGQPGKIDIRIGKPDVSRLPPCTAHEAFTPPGTRLLGKTHIGVRCLGPSTWNILVPTTISVTGTYLVTSRSIMAGQVLQAGDFVVREGDLGALPTGLLGDPAAAIGKSARMSLGAGQPLRGDALIAPLVIRQNQTVRVISRGPGFAATAEGKALNNASEGQTVNVRMSSGQTASGLARADGSVEISF